MDLSWFTCWLLHATAKLSQRLSWLVYQSICMSASPCPLLPSLLPTSTKIDVQKETNRNKKQQCKMLDGQYVNNLWTYNVLKQSWGKWWSPWIKWINKTWLHMVSKSSTRVLFVGKDLSCSELQFGVPSGNSFRCDHMCPQPQTARKHDVNGTCKEKFTEIWNIFCIAHQI
jgi:hypothetical protein